jgi:predicted dehydrogenase
MAPASTPPTSPLTRRDALRSIALGLAACAVPRPVRAQARPGKLRLAFVGVAGQGEGAVRSHTGQHYAAFCDVDEAHAAHVFAGFPQVPRYRDYRRMLDRHARELDAVVVSTPDHAHFPIALAAMQRGLHVYVEKPLAPTIWECRQLAAAAARHGVRTQLGIQGHASGALRLVREWLDAGAAGPVDTVFLWTDRMQPFRYTWSPTFAPGETPPPTLDWDLWLAARRPRPYSHLYLPNRWRNWWDFGTGPIGDIGVHMFDVLEFALDLGLPTLVSAETPARSLQTAPPWTIARWEFPARGLRPPVVVHWCNGTRNGVALRPPSVPRLPPEVVAERTNGIALAGRDGTLFIADMRAESAPRIFPEAREREFLASRPRPTLPRPVGGHFRDWFDAIRDGREAGASFAYGAPLTEAVLLGVLAQRTGRPIRWDPVAMRAVGAPEADAFLAPILRDGWDSA